jgi:hypothetical protein
MGSQTLCRAGLAAIAAVTIAASPSLARANGSDLPPEVVLQGFVKPVDGRLQLLVRIPLVFIQPFAVPKRGPGYLDLTRIDNVLQQAATAASRQITLFEDGARLVPTVRRARISVLSDRSFRDYATALALIEGPPLAPDTELFWNQGFFDTEIDYPIHSPNGHFSVSVNVMPDLGSRVRLQLQFLPVGASPRNFELTGGSTSVALDPTWYEAAWLFMKQGFLGVFATDRIIFLLCLVAPFRRLKGLLAVIVVLAALQALTLTASAAGAVAENHWLPAFVDTSFAVAILLLAIGNLGVPDVRRRWFIGAVIGGLGGFGLGRVLSELLQLGGSHAVVAIASYNAGVALAEIASLLIAVAALRALFALVLGPSLGVIVLSALAAHVAWHAMVDAYHELAHQVGHTIEAGLLSVTAWNAALWLAPAVVIGAAAWFLPRGFGGPAYPTLLAALRRRDGD